MQLFYDGDEDYPVEEYDEVVVIAAEFRFPATIKKVLPKIKQVIVGFENIDPVLDLIVLRKQARVPLSAIEFVGRSM
ncbi:hypothetical protein [Mesorhizobium australicum]|uniref:Uncharacterized protein n=1 Tax=Mesorhizobium australicum TaxID=536018 RepID=A0A1X7NWS6_9HYPH|nr:hypothetical protein [Mesorhizobium australicum]SMH42235.1 hypothetical protein SAMN02982922_2719 [Mesorhizobium australicum]